MNSFGNQVDPVEVALTVDPEHYVLFAFVGLPVQHLLDHGNGSGDPVPLRHVHDFEDRMPLQ